MASSAWERVANPDPERWSRLPPGGARSTLYAQLMPWLPQFGHCLALGVWTVLPAASAAAIAGPFPHPDDPVELLYPPTMWA